MAFYVKPENCNGYGTAHGGMLMALADFAMASSAMKNKEQSNNNCKFSFGICSSSSEGQSSNY